MVIAVVIAMRAEGCVSTTTDTILRIQYACYMKSTARFRVRVDLVSS